MEQMEQQVTVYDDNNVLVGTTFKRRARQLVMKRRADWTDESCAAIRLTLSEKKEETILDKAISVSGLPVGNNSARAASDSEAIGIREADDFYKEDELLRLARKRVKNKHNLIAHIVAYPVAFIVSLSIMAGLLDNYLDTFGIAFYFGAMSAWGVFVVSRVVVYFLPSIKNMKRFGRRDPVKAEYVKLKNMEPGRRAAEYERI